jgi:hypothetical protein
MAGVAAGKSGRLDGAVVAKGQASDLGPRTL